MNGAYKNGDMAAIADAMDERYQEGDAYSYELPWDIQRHKSLHQELANLVTRVIHIWSRHIPLRVTDLGCGMKTTFSLPYIRDALRTFDLDVTLVDISAAAIRRLREERGGELEAAWGPRVSWQFRAAPAEYLQSVAEDQHLIVSVESIEHWSDVDAGLDGVHAALVPGGFFVLTTPNRDSLHVRMARKLGYEPPFCAEDHTYEFGHEELDRLLKRHGLVKVAETGVGLAPYWALEGFLGGAMRDLTDNDPEVIQWLDMIGRRCPEFSFCQVKAFRKEEPQDV